MQPPTPTSSHTTALTFNCVSVFLMWNSNPVGTVLSLLILSFSKAKASSSKRLASCACASESSFPHTTSDLQCHVSSCFIPHPVLNTFILQYCSKQTGLEIQYKISWVHTIYKHMYPMHTCILSLSLCICIPHTRSLL